MKTDFHTLFNISLNPDSAFLQLFLHEPAELNTK